MTHAMSAADAEADHKLILGSRVSGTPVFNHSGESLGHVDDLSIERKSGRIVYGIMSFGGFLGIGEKFHPIPWSLLDYNPERGGYVVALDRATLEGAPHYERDELVTLGGPSRKQYDQRIFDYYGPFGPMPYW
ncbi:PRC-barrel domain-containing protein [Sphingomonas sp. SRS2]|uniref:PRC-barrel domain-containing protein n=1 Tax=Sphingomonas sp. SRS2 TaxID=133190 RepID=UPI000618455A|nr:PRC-barrel domain-containing protein [Sphingomonas sp. SRS2]KKC27908.1 photosystem reaction center protein H [Sphingomonas sp. SRS2]